MAVLANEQRSRPRLAAGAGWIHHTSSISLPADTYIGRVTLTVADFDRSREFYERVIGLRTLDETGDNARLGAEDGAPVVELVGDRAAPQREPGTTGLFHFAIRVPGRQELGRALRRVVAAGWPLAGASDHLVSEALYLADREGSGIEIYRDRPREEWRRVDGQIEMATLPLDLDAILAESGAHGESPGAPVGTRMGHVHLNVADLDAAEAFYSGVLGFDVTVRGYPGALFLSAGGYHHHIGVNTWAGEGALPPRPGSRGLRHFEIVLPDTATLADVERRLRAAGAESRADGGGLRVADPPDGDGPRVADPPDGGGLLVADPSGNGILLSAAPSRHHGPG